MKYSNLGMFTNSEEFCNGSTVVAVKWFETESFMNALSKLGLDRGVDFEDVHSPNRAMHLTYFKLKSDYAKNILLTVSTYEQSSAPDFFLCVPCKK